MISRLLVPALNAAAEVCTKDATLKEMRSRKRGFQREFKFMSEFMSLACQHAKLDLTATLLSVLMQSKQNVPLPSALPMNLVAADVSPRTLSGRKISADSRRRLRFRGSRRENPRGIRSPKEREKNSDAQIYPTIK